MKLEKEVVLLKSELTNHIDALRDKDKEIEAIQHAFVTKEEEILHVAEVRPLLFYYFLVLRLSLKHCSCRTTRR